MPAPLRSFAAVAAVGLLLTACPAAHEDGADDASLVVGVQTAPDLASLVGSVHVVAKVDGAVAHDETFPGTGLPKEIVLQGHAGARAEVLATALAPNAAPGAAPLVRRLAAAPLVPNAKKLLRVSLDARCLEIAFAGGPPPTVCNAPETCLAGRCVPSDVPENQLEDYEPAWATTPPDVCRPANHGPPEVVLGTGQTDYAPLVDGQVLQLEKGPQGGHHIWIAVRMRNLRQSGSATTITSAIVGDPTPVPPTAYVFTFDPDEGGYCKLYGLRYQVDAGAADLATAYQRFLGKPLQVTVSVKDSTGATASSTHTVQIADKLLCPDGTDSCNTPP